MNDLKTILLTTDFSETSRGAIEPAIALARRFGAKLLLVHVGDFFPPVVEEYYMAINVDEIRRHAQEQARRQLAEFAEKYISEVEVEVIALVGVPHVEIVKLATERRVDLIVMATHGRGFISHAILGSTTERVLRRAPCPLLAVRAQEPA